MIAFSSVTKVLQRSINQENRYNMYNLSSRNTKWENWALDETFENIGLDGTQHKVRLSQYKEGENFEEKENICGLIKTKG
jgi:hypothetical protein